jgi:hypothetical protein
LILIIVADVHEFVVNPFGNREVVVIFLIIIFVVDHRVLLSCRKVDRAATGAAATLDGVGSVDLNVIVRGLCGGVLLAKCLIHL